METCSRCRGIRVHDPVETPFTMAWNTHFPFRPLVTGRCRAPEVPLGTSRRCAERRIFHGVREAFSLTLMRCLIVGGTRVIGPHVVRRLHMRGWNIAVLHRGLHLAAPPANVLRIIDDCAG